MSSWIGNVLPIVVGVVVDHSRPIYCLLGSLPHHSIHHFRKQQSFSKFSISFICFNKVLNTMYASMTSNPFQIKFHLECFEIFLYFPCNPIFWQSEISNVPTTSDYQDCDVIPRLSLMAQHINNIIQKDIVFCRNFLTVIFTDNVFLWMILYEFYFQY